MKLIYPPASTIYKRDVFKINGKFHGLKLNNRKKHVMDDVCNFF